MANLICRNSIRIFQDAKNYNFLPYCKVVVQSNTRRFYAEDSAARYFTKKHEWVVVSENVGTIGISQYAQDSLGDIVFVQLPDVGSEVNPHDECGALESVKAASELYSPVSGTVTEINTALEEKPELVNKSCYDEGWLFKLKLKDPVEIKSLLSEDQYNEFLKSDH